MTALLLDGLTVAISPLIALMRDQVTSLEARGLRVAALHSHVVGYGMWIAMDADIRVATSDTSFWLPPCNRNKIAV